MVLAHRAGYYKKTLARQVIPLVPGYRTALSSRPEVLSIFVIGVNTCILVITGNIFVIAFHIFLIAFHIFVIAINILVIAFNTFVIAFHIFVIVVNIFVIAFHIFVTAVNILVIAFNIFVIAINILGIAFHIFLLHYGRFLKNICFKLQIKLLCLRIKARRIPDETTVLTLIVDF